MKRRRFVTAIAAAPAVPALLSQTPPVNNTPRPSPSTPPPADTTQPPAPFNRTPPAVTELPPLEYTVADDVADMQPRFFNAAQLAALKKLSDLLMPAMGDMPGALDAKAPEFLDFLLSESPADRQQLYRAGLDALNGAARKRFSKAFADVDASQAAALLAPLRQPWTFDAPADPLAKFLHAAKQDVRTATINSREYASVAEASGRRGFGGVGLYWFPLD